MRRRAIAGQIALTVIMVQCKGRCGWGVLQRQAAAAGAGATYYGIMDMSEACMRGVTIGNADGKSFTGSHGNGVLNSTGDADASNWPGTSASGTGLSWRYLVQWCHVRTCSDRSDASNTQSGRGSNWAV